MAKIIYNCLKMIFGGSFATDLSKWMESLFGTLATLMSGESSIMVVAMNAFSGVACAMMVMYFYMDLTAQASRDQITFEKLIQAFIKLLVAFAILAVLPDLLKYIVDFGKAFFQLVSKGEFKTNLKEGKVTKLEYKFGSAPVTSKFPDYKGAVKDAFENKYSGVRNQIASLGILATCIVCWLIMLIATVVGFFLATSNAIMFLVRAVFSPIAVVQCFEDGTRSSGIRYIKTLLADAITMGVMIGIIYVSNYFTAGMVADEIKGDGTKALIELNNIEYYLSGMILVKIIVARLATVGAMAGASRLAKEVMGA